MQHKFLLPNHFFVAVNNAFSSLAKDGRPLGYDRFEIDDNLTSYHKLVLELDCNGQQLLQLGIKIGTELAKDSINQVDTTVRTTVPSPELPGIIKGMLSDDDLIHNAKIIRTEKGNLEAVKYIYDVRERGLRDAKDFFDKIPK